VLHKTNPRNTWTSLQQARRLPCSAGAIACEELAGPGRTQRPLVRPCSLSSNNIFDPATPFGDRSLLRIANGYANVLHRYRPSSCANACTCSPAARRGCSTWTTMASSPAGRRTWSIFEARTPEQAIAESASPVPALEAGRHTVRWHAPEPLRH
jgi:hypothetical protein